MLLLLLLLLLANTQILACSHEPFLREWSVATRRAPDQSKLAFISGDVIVAMGAGIDSSSHSQRR